MPTGTRHPAGHYPTLQSGRTYYLAVVNATGTWDPSYFIPYYNVIATSDFGWSDTNSSYNWVTSGVPFPPLRKNLNWAFGFYGTADIVSTGPPVKIDNTTPGKLEYTSWANIASLK
jgi:hypothetical protein